MDDNILNLELDDNVGNGLAKINYNLLNINQDYCNLNIFFQENDKFLTSVENLMDELDVLIPKINYDYLEKLEATVHVLSSYWDKLEFTVQYPFNPVNGFISKIINAGEFGGLTSYDDEDKQTNFIADAMVKAKLYPSRSDAIKGIDDKGVVYVFRDNNGNFTRWEYFDNTLIFNMSVDSSNNFYYNGRLVDLYKLPYYSIIAPRNINLAIDGTTIDFDDKVIRQKGNVLRADRTSITQSSYMAFKVKVRRVISDTDEPLDVESLQDSPEIRVLNEIIANNNPVYKAKIAKVNDDVLESVLQNPFLNTTCLTFLNKSYSPQKYLDGTIVNVSMFLYNTTGLDTARATVRTSYFGPDRVSVINKRFIRKVRKKRKKGKLMNQTLVTILPGQPLSKNEAISEEAITRNAPDSNTTFTVNFSKTDVYVERIVLVKYRKNSKIEFNTNKITGKRTSKVVHYWEFVSANLGPKYSKGNTSLKTVDNAPVFVKTAPTKSEILAFPTQMITETGDILNDKSGNTFLIDNTE